jgi:hypothetical protein
VVANQRITVPNRSVCARIASARLASMKYGFHDEINVGTADDDDFLAHGISFLLQAFCLS